MAEQPEHRPETGPPENKADCCEVSPAPEAAPLTPFGRARRIVWRALILIAGSAVILAGVVLSLPGIPGPGVVVILAGLALLATEFAFARRLLQRLRERAKDGVSGIREWWHRRREP